MITRIHVNQHKIKANKKDAADQLVLTIKQGGKTYMANHFEITGPSKVVYLPDKPLSCGATVWIETDMPPIDANWPETN